jgi:hypothetical protein
MTVHTGSETRRAATGGIVAGLIGGLVLAAFLLLVNLLQGQDFWSVMKLAAAPFLGMRAQVPGFDTVAIALGLLCHFAVSAIWGLLFGLAFHGLSRKGTLVAGAFWGIVVWVGMYFVVLPIVGLGAMAGQVPVLLSLVEHVLFGVALAAAYVPYQRQAPRMEGPTYREMGSGRRIGAT